MLHEFVLIFIFVYIKFVTVLCGKMEVFLRECKENLKNYDQFEKIQIVLGSEACDLDSAVSSLTTAYFLHKIQNSQKIVLPVLNVKRNDLKLHSEVAFFLEETSIPLDNVICRDEVDFKQLQDGGKLDLILVDHNVLSTEDSVLEPYVIRVIDHHVVEHPDRSNRCTTKIEPVGSCCTLVAEEMFKIEPSILDPQIAMLLYGTILLDTVCLAESAKRVTSKDIEIAEKLEKLLEGISREEVFKTLQKAKFDVSELTDEQLLQKDLKMVSNNSTTIAISSVPTLLESRLNQAAMESALVKFCYEKQLQAVILMGVETNEDKKTIRRQLAVYSPNPQTLEKLTGFLKTLTDPSLELEAFSVKITSICAFEQGNSALSRKFVLPAVRSFMFKDTDLQGMLKQLPLKAEDTNCSQEHNTLEHLVDEEDTVKLFHMESTELSNDYQTETLDFPDSPKHSNLLKISLQLQDQLEEDTTLASVNITPTSEKQGPRKERTESIGTGSRRKKISVNPDILRSDATDDDQKSLSSLSNKSDADVFSPVEDLVIPDDIDTPEELENSEYSSTSEPIPEMSAAEEFEEERSWKTCVINGIERKIDMKVIEPYKKVLSHGGYYGSTRNAIIIFCACYLPDRSRKDYDYVMDNLFLYVLTTLDQLVAEDYILVYLHGATQRTNMPSFGWLKRCYQMIDRRLRKNLKGLYLVHPTFWLKTIVIMTRPFISTKFSRKLRFVDNLEELSNLIPMDHVCIPDKVKELEFQRMIKEKKKLMKNKKTKPGPIHATQDVA